ncbi:Hachiman antiphage defense system protein HamA [Pseudomonas sp. xss_2]|uniref:Hachiman antiphage defense system protein HamA n=1 Tax=Pseudomonas sp. xss_2 TaxID=3367215 RepID=UPI00370B9C17
MNDEEQTRKATRGTCFSISPNLLLTAYHVISNGGKIKVYFSSDEYDRGQYIYAKCIHWNTDSDFAILEIESSAGNFIDLYSTGISLDAEVKSCGYPIEKEHYHAPINVRVTNSFENMTSREYSFEVSQSDTISAYQGMSGSPVLYHGLCIGVLLVQQGTNTLYAVSLKDILSDTLANKIITDSIPNIKIQDGINYEPPKHPPSPFKYCINCNIDQPNIKGIDIGFTMKIWNINNLTETVYEWIIDYCLSHKERANFTGVQRSLFKYARANYPGNDINALGDFFLHIAIRDSYNTIPVMNKVFDANNKTFSCTHAILNLDTIELWIGASSVSTNIEDAVKAAIDNIEYIASITTLKHRLYTLTAEIDGSWPHVDKLKRLADSNLSLDDRFDKIIIPVFIMHDSAIIKEYDKNSFIELFKEKIQYCRSIFSGSIKPNLIDLIDLRVFYFPVSDISFVHSALLQELNS